MPILFLLMRGCSKIFVLGTLTINLLLYCTSKPQVGQEDGAGYLPELMLLLLFLTYSVKETVISYAMNGVIK